MVFSCSLRQVRSKLHWHASALLSQRSHFCTKALHFGVSRAQGCSLPIEICPVALQERSLTPQYVSMFSVIHVTKMLLYNLGHPHIMSSSRQMIIGSVSPTVFSSANRFDIGRCIKVVEKNFLISIFRGLKSYFFHIESFFFSYLYLFI